MLSDYEMPSNIDVHPPSTRVEKTALIDWPAIQELMEVMTQPVLERQLQTVYRPETGALAECVAVVLKGDPAQQYAVVHKLKGGLLLLGLLALANHCTRGQDRLKATPPQALDQQWTDGLGELADKTRDELAHHFDIFPQTPSGTAAR
jgi:HPt (histidine-containing phosphotransfer) domain-containing protein